MLKKIYIFEAVFIQPDGFFQSKIKKIIGAGTKSQAINKVLVVGPATPITPDNIPESTVSTNITNLKRLFGFFKFKKIMLFSSTLNSPFQQMFF